MALSMAAAQEAGVAEGRVTSSTDHNGIAGVAVTIGSAHAFTDLSGAFRITGILPGAHTISFSAAGYLKRDPIAFRLDTLVEPARLDIELIAESSISGRVLNGQGQPVAGVPVEITADVRGTGTTWSIWGATTDAEGHYEVGGLRPGKYLVMARPKGLASPPPSEAERRVWANTYYPSAQRRGEAARIALRGGTHESGCDIRLLALPAHTIRGMVYDPAGKPANADVTLIPADGLGQPLPESRTTAYAGAFEFPAVCSGEWRLVADMRRGPDILRGDGAVDLTDRDSTNVVLRMAAPFSLRALVDPDIPGKLPTIELYPAESPPSGAAFSSAESDGALRFFHVYPTRYRILVFGAIDGHYLDSILLGDRDVLGKDVLLTEGMPPIRIVYKPDSSGVRGTVENCGGASVLLLPEDEALWDFRFLRRASCDSGGRFQVVGLRPGDWFALAVDRVDSTGLDDLATLRRLANLGEKIQVESGRLTTIDLKIQPWPE